MTDTTAVDRDLAEKIRALPMRAWVELAVAGKVRGYLLARGLRALLDPPWRGALVGPGTRKLTRWVDLTQGLVPYTEPTLEAVLARPRHRSRLVLYLWAKAAVDLALVTPDDAPPEGPGPWQSVARKPTREEESAWRRYEGERAQREHLRRLGRPTSELLDPPRPERQVHGAGKHACVYVWAPDPRGVVRIDWPSEGAVRLTAPRSER